MNLELNSNYSYSLAMTSNSVKGNQTINKKPSTWLLSRYHDESYISSKNTLAHILSQRNVLDNFLLRLPFINPQSSFLLLWNLFMQLVILFNFCQIPIVIFFTQQVFFQEFQSTTAIEINIICIISLFIQMILVRPLTGLYRSGFLVQSHKLIIKEYLKFEFFLNLISWIFLIAYATVRNPNYIFLKLVFYLNVYELYQIDQQILNKLELHRLRHAAYRLLKIVFILLFVVLWISCVYFAIDYHYYKMKEESVYYPTNLWLTNSVCSQYQGGQEFIDLVAMYPWYVWLNYAFYWTLQSITGVGYGDMTPRNPPEVIFCNIVILFLNIYYALFINIVWEIIFEVNATGSVKSSHLKLVNKYQKKYQLNKELTNKLGSYMFEMWEHGKSQETEKVIHQNLSEDLKNQLFFIKQKKFFSEIPLFSKSILRVKSDESFELFQKLASYLEEKKYGQDEVITEAGKVSHKICSILHGQVTITYPNSKLFIKLKKDESFSVTNTLIQRKSPYSAISKIFCKILSLDFDKLIAELKKTTFIYEKYRQKIEELILQNRNQITGENCWVCSNPAHPTHLCVQYFEWMSELKNIQQILANREIVRRRKEFIFSFTPKQSRNFFNRRSMKKEKKIIQIQEIKNLTFEKVHSFKFYQTPHCI